MQPSKIQDRAIGRWRSLLPALGVHERFLTGKHGPCPCCGGTDRFRWDDKAGSGSYYCNQCGAGSGVDLVMKANKVPFAEAKRMIESLLPTAEISIPKAGRGSQLDARHHIERIWCDANPLDGFDPGSLYLASRGLKMAKYPTQLRWIAKTGYAHEDKTKTWHPALLAKMVSPDAKTWTVHRTFLDRDGRKAKVPTVRKLMPGSVPRGGAVRLASSAETMGIAEGIETALAASMLFEVPVWSALNAGNLVHWVPPPTARNIIVFGDNDPSFTGHYSAYALAHRLSSEGYHVEVRIPETEATDWADEWAAENSAPRRVREIAEMHA